MQRTRKSVRARPARRQEHPTTLTLFRLWAGIGLQSFGGGASTLLLIQRAFVTERGWVEAEEMSDFWNLCQLTPGINLLALTVLIGRKLGGARGIVASLVGLLLPSATVTCLLAAGFTAVQHSSVVHAILRGVIPATAGIMAVVAYNFAQPLLTRGQREGSRALYLSIAVILLSALALIALKLSVIAMLAGVAVIGVAVFTPRHATGTASLASQPSREEKQP